MLTGLNTKFTDADSDPLTYSATSSNTAAATVSVSGTSLTVTPVWAGTSTISVKANDGVVDSSPLTFTVTLTDNGTNFGTNLLTDVTFGGITGKEVFVATGGTKLYTSRDGLNWQNTYTVSDAINFGIAGATSNSCIFNLLGDTNAPGAGGSTCLKRTLQ